MGEKELQKKVEELQNPCRINQKSSLRLNLKS